MANLTKMKFKNSTNPVLLEIFAESLLTEKTTTMELGANCITFIAPKWANKHIIRNGINTVFGCEVMNVRIINTKGKRKQIKGRRESYYTSSVKKVHVRVNNIEKIAEVLR